MARKSISRNPLKNRGDSGGVKIQLGNKYDDPTPVASEAYVDDEVYVTLDCEWFRNHPNSIRNIVLAYGLRLDFRSLHTVLILYPSGPTRRARLNLSTLLTKLFRQAIPKILAKIPKSITLLIHYGRGDLSSLRDFPALKGELDVLNNCFATSGSGVKVKLDLDDIDPKTGMPYALLSRVPKSRRVKVNADSSDEEIVTVNFRDTSLLSVAGSGGLEALGHLVGIPKVELPEGFSKSRMDLLLEKKGTFFEKYLTADLAIPPTYYRRFRKVLIADMKLKKVPATLGSCAVAKFKLVLSGLVDSSGVPLTSARVFGTMRKKYKKYNIRLGRYTSVTVDTLILARTLFESVMSEGYHGGRTETMHSGPTDAGVLVYDVDLKSAYPSGMAVIGVPDYSRAYTTRNIDNFTRSTLGVAQIEFVNPSELKFPFFGIRSDNDHGLIFPVRGIAICTAPEIAAARAFGVQITVIIGAIIPWGDNKTRPFLKFMRELIDLREALKEYDGSGKKVDTLESLTIKTISNSLYGKTAQAVRPSKSYDSKSQSNRPLSPSSVTNAAFAAFTTGIVRATVAEMMNSIPADREVQSCSTDGFLTSAQKEEVPVTRRVSRMLGNARSLLMDGDASLLEIKKHASQVFLARNRVACTITVGAGSKPVIARGGVKVPREVDDQNAFMLDLILDRTYGSKHVREDFISIAEQIKTDGDLVSRRRETTLNFEPDMKRKLVNPRMVMIADGHRAGEWHLATDSVPHETIDDFEQTRTIFDGWRHSRGRCLKNMDDWENWTDYLEANLASTGSGKRSYQNASGSAGDFQRQFLRALVRGQFGLDIGGETYAQVAEWLTKIGEKTSRNSVKNATRPDARLVPHSVAATPRTLPLLVKALAKYPAFDWGQMFVAGHRDRVLEYIRKNTRKPKAGGVS